MNPIQTFLCLAYPDRQKVLAGIPEGEWEDKILSKSTMLKLGLKGSPKLSKVLLNLGFDNSEVSRLLGSQKGSRSWLSSSILEQGDSIHYASCQARDPRAKWLRDGGSPSLSAVEEDLVAFNEGHLLMWVVGRPMSEDGEGFKARAKVRLLFKEGEVSGAYIDQVYGQPGLLKLEELEELLFEKFGFEVPLLELDPKGELYEVPSAHVGYQDTLHAGRPLRFIKAERNLLIKVLKARMKLAIVRRAPLKDTVLYGGLNFKVGTLPYPQWRGDLRSAHRMCKILGIKSGISRMRPGQVTWQGKQFSIDYYGPNEYWVCFNNDPEPSYLLSRYYGCLLVEADVPEMGFAVAQDLPLNGWGDPFTEW